ncbi:MAG TPA: twin-arginine translocation signal domain-containing protein [Acidobacteria bacterium]|nr:twin-arginine translocation signal domain-containing protein [Acidobacteriota bacterium]
MDRRPKWEPILARALSRRDAMRLLGAGAAGAGLGLTAGCGPELVSEPAPAPTRAAVTFPDGAIVRTVLGDVDPAALGTGATLFHEHLAFNFSSPPPEPRAPDTPPPPRPTDEEMVDLLVEELRMAAFDGVSCIVDSSIGPRTEQQLANLTAMATRSGVHIVLGGSYFLQPRYPEEIIQLPEEEVAAHLVAQAGRERWGALGEVGSSFPEMHDDERKMIRAISQVHARTGLPIFTHVPHESCPSCALDQIDSYEAQGVDMAHLCIGHLSTIKRSDDPGWETHKEIARRGAFLGFDTVGHQMSASFIPEREKVDMVLNALEAGLEDHILLSSDFANTTQIKANWGNGFSTVLVQFVPKLRYFGVPEETIQKILVDNSRRWLAYQPTSA